MAKGFLSKVTYNNWLWILGLFFLSLSAIISFFDVPNQMTAHPSPTTLVLLPGCGGMAQSLQDFFSNFRIHYLFSFVMVIIGGVLMQYLSSENRLIRVRSFFPFFWYCVLSASLFPHVIPSRAFISAIFIIGACYRFFSVTEKKDMNRALFDASLLLALASLTLNRLVWMLPFMWMAASHVQPLSLRNIAASLIGFVSVYWIIAGISFLWGDYRYLQNWMENVSQFAWMDFAALTPMAVLYIGFMGFLLLISVGSFIRQQNQDKLITRNHLYGVLMLWLGELLIWLTAVNSNTAFLFLLLIPTLVFYSHYFSLKDTLFSRFLFFVQLTFSLLAFFLFQES